MEAGDIRFDMEHPDLRGLLASLKEISPKVATRLRREFRQSGEDIIAGQRAKLREGGSSSTGLREEIARGLKVRVVAGKTRQGIDVKTTGPKRGGYNLARLMQAAQFRHPVFGSDAWVDQSGHPYFFEPATDELRDLMLNRIEKAIEESLAEAAKLV